MQPIQSIKQITNGPGVCSNPFTLASKGSSCTLSLQVNGSQLTHPIYDGPVVCQQGSALQCYRPNASNVLKIKRIENQYTVGGTVTGLTGTLTLLNNGNDLLTTSTDGNYTFNTPLTEGETYSVTIRTQPVGQTCTLNNSVGTIQGLNVTNINVTCATNSYSVGGEVSGLSDSVVLTNNGTDALTITNNGPFVFPTALAEGSLYEVSVPNQPSTQICTVSNGMGVIGSSNVNNVTVICATTAYTVGGNITGLTGTVTLSNNGDLLTTSTDGAFTFSEPVAQGSTYNVIVDTMPIG